MDSPVGIIRDSRFLDHVTGEGHPESLRRLAAIYDMLDREMSEKAIRNGHFIPVTPHPAEEAQILLAHSPEYLSLIKNTAGKELFALTADTHVSEGSYAAALLAAGGLIEAAARSVKGDLRRAFSLNRPPGHHAERSRAMGYCLFNNVAIAALAARRDLGLKRVMIVDWDLHHGNGTQHIFENDPSVLFFSIHQYPLFPGTGIYTEVGRGPGEGYTVNIPISKKYGDAEYAAIFQKLLRPIALAFRPELLLVSAGFDTHHLDPIGGMRMTPEGFAGLTRSLMEIADLCCCGRLLLTLEGGYHLAALTESVKAVLLEMAGITHTDPEEMAASANPRKVAYAILRCSHVHGRFWKSLKG